MRETRVKRTRGIPGVYTVTLSVDGPAGSDNEVKPGCVVVYEFGVCLPLVTRGG
ncbi:MAG: hypothetical protein R6X31_13160 [Anaerolineae bacterium]